MASQPEEQRTNLPFEPTRKRKKKPKTAPDSASEFKSESQPSPQAQRKAQASLSAIPDGVSKRMVRRMAFFSGIPTSLGILSFFVFYWIVTQELLELPPYTVVLVSMGFFGLGVLGLSYGLISASWDEERVGTWFGWEEFTTNLQRIFSAWRSARQERGQE
ncbi:MAG: PAM68 family protein [Halothece sp. Uz-M2-17]|nr:PAM68 family protein [Halothece sp. Uz-M2-17]